MAGPLFTRGEVEFNRDLAWWLRDKYEYEVYNPQEHEDKFHHNPELERAVWQHLESVQTATVLLMNLDYEDLGAGVEAGYALAQNTTILYYWTDKRNNPLELGQSYMVTQNGMSHSVMDYCGGPVIPTAEDIAEATNIRFEQLESQGKL